MTISIGSANLVVRVPMSILYDTSPDNPYFSDENKDDEAIFFFPILGRRRLLRGVYPELLCRDRVRNTPTT